MEEKELCSRRTLLGKKKKYLLLGIAMIALAITAIVINIIIRVNSAAAYGEHAFKLYQGPYWAGWGTLIVSLALAAYFFYRYLTQKQGEIVITLTNKRIKMAFSEGKYYFEDSFLLNKIVSFSCEKRNGVSIVFTTVKKDYVFNNLDEEFYNLFLGTI